jgi:serine/threonine protein kinase
VLCVGAGQFYTAPELLESAEAPPAGTQKGDVYSFAIILLETMYRILPYTDSSGHYPMVAKGKRCRSM